VVKRLVVIYYVLFCLLVNSTRAAKKHAVFSVSLSDMVSQARIFDTMTLIDLNVVFSFCRHWLVRATRRGMYRHFVSGSEK
jgi:hypothetical protein